MALFRAFCKFISKVHTLQTIVPSMMSQIFVKCLVLEDWNGTRELIFQDTAVELFASLSAFFL